MYSSYYPRLSVSQASLVLALGVKQLLSRSMQTLSAGGLSAKGRECVASTHDGQFMWFLDIYGVRGASEPRG